MNNGEIETVVEMCDGDTEGTLRGLEAVLEEHGLPLLGCIRRVLQSRGITYNVEEMAADIFQQVAMELLLSASNEDLLNVASLKGYVYSAARRRTLCYLRDEGRRADKPSASETFWEMTDRLLSQEGIEPTEASDWEQALAECIKKLEGKKREYVLLLADSCDDPITPKEIARLHGVSPESVRNRLHDARDDLADCLRSKGQTLPLRRKGASQ
jgi:RNA polymerase sigma factor (sigma-70 family)